MVPGVLLDPYISQGDKRSAETTIVSKGLSQKYVKYNVAVQMAQYSTESSY